MTDPRNAWAQSAMDALGHHHQARLTAYGNSMRPRILSGSTVTLSPVCVWTPGDVVLVTLDDGRVTLHAIKDIQTDPETNWPKALIGDERGNLDGWVPLSRIHGLVIAVEPPAPKENP